MLTISIDGACRRNGKPSCVSSGGVFIMHPSGEMETHAVYEHGSTNQRGELFALLTALEYLANANVEACIITDSEYIFNAMTKQWYVNWPYNNWLTAAGEPVKNSDIWKKIGSVELNEPVHFYHIKGHCIPFGKVTATKMLDADHTGASLRKLVEDKFDACRTTKADVFEAAQQLSVKNNGFELPSDTFRLFVVANTIADAIATRMVEIADREM